jgi:hypothetical protein
MPENVRCAGCGFLAVRKTDTRELVEAEDEFRKWFEVPLTAAGHSMFCPRRFAPWGRSTYPRKATAATRRSTSERDSSA